MARHLFRVSWAYFLVWEIGLFSAPAEIIPDVSDAPFLIRSWQADQGLPNNTVNAIVQTHDGYFWLGTDEGLVRFDGVRCRIFGLKEGLRSLQISALLEDRQGGLWIGTSGGGLSRLFNDRIETYTTKDGLAGDSIHTLLEDTNGDVWIGTPTGLTRWRNGRFEPAPGNLGTTFIFQLTQDWQGGIWAATLHDGLIRFADGKCSSIPGPIVSTNINPSCVFADNRGRIWVGSRDQYFSCYENGQWRVFGGGEDLSPVVIDRVTQTRDGTIWAGSEDKGLYYFQGDKFKVLRKGDGMPDNAILALCPGNPRFLWVGTQSGGLCRIGPRKLSVYHPMEGSTECQLRCLAETTNGELYVSTRGQGLYRWQGDNFQQILNAQPMSSHLVVEALLSGRDGSLWWGAGPALFQWKNGKLLSNYNSPPWSDGDSIRSLCESGDGRIWVGTFNGKCGLLDPRQGNFIPIPGLYGKPVITLLQAPDQTLWIGSMGGGLARFKDGKLTVFTTKDGLGSDLIRALLLDPDGTLWIGTDGGGLTRYANGRFNTFTTQQGLIDNDVFQLLSDADDGLWLGCNRGICRVSKEALNDVVSNKIPEVHPLIYGHAEGMPSQQCIASFGAALKTSAGELCFNTAQGIVIIDPRQQTNNLTLPTVLLEDVLVDGHRVPLADFLKIPPGRHDFGFYYTGLNYDAPEQIRFRYQLEGLDQDWVYAGGGHVAHYTYLPPGRFRFRVTANNGNGLWSQNEAGISFTVQFHFWQTLWFKAVFTLTGIGLLVLGVRLAEHRRYRVRLKRLEQEQGMELERARIARDLHDELGSSLARISRLSDLGQVRDQGVDRLKKRIEGISDFAVRTARSLDEIVWAVNPRNDSLRSLLLYATQFSRELFEDTGINCRYQIPSDLPQSPLPPEVRHNLFLVIKEALNNALKHSHADEILLCAKIDEKHFEIVIQDNGTGFDPAAMQDRSGHNGLANMRHRIEAIGGRFHIQSRAGAGTTISFAIDCRVLAGAKNEKPQ